MTACFVAAALTAAGLTPAFQPQAFHGEPSGRLTEAEVRNLVVWTGFPADVVDDFVGIAWCESRFNPRAVGSNKNGTHDHGLWQINDGYGRPSWDGWDRRYTPKGNAELAKIVYDSQGRDAWYAWKYRNKPGRPEKKCWDDWTKR